MSAGLSDGFERKISVWEFKIKLIKGKVRFVK